MSAEERLSSLLVKLGLADQSQLPLLNAPGANGPIRILSLLKNSNETTTIVEVAEALKIDYYDFNDSSLFRQLTIADFANKVDIDFCRQHKMVPLMEDALGIVTAFANPLDEEARRIAEFSLAKPIVPVIAEEEKILELLNRYLAKDQVKLDEKFKLPDNAQQLDVEISVKNQGTIDIKNFNTIQMTISRC